MFRFPKINSAQLWSSFVLLVLEIGVYNLSGWSACQVIWTFHQNLLISVPSAITTVKMPTFFEDYKRCMHILYHILDLAWPR